MTEQEFQVKSETLKGQIRTEKVNQLTEQVAQEKEVTTQEKIKTATAKVQTVETREDNRIASLKLQGKQKDARVLRATNLRKDLDGEHQERLNTLQPKYYKAQIETVETNIQELESNLKNRRELLKQQGILS
jgi:predicted methyltransferase MtxX (methanogen marker protein 4)